MAGWNGSGSVSVTYTFTAGTTISSSQVNQNYTDLTGAVQNTVAKDGQNTPTANLPMGGYKHTGVLATSGSSSRTEYASAATVQDGAVLWGGTAGGTANAHTITLSPAITSYVAGQKFAYIAGSSANSGATTLAVNGLAAKPITKDGTTALAASDIPPSEIVEVVYDGTQFRLISPRPSLVSRTIYGSPGASTWTKSVSLPADATYVRIRVWGAGGSGGGWASGNYAGGGGGGGYSEKTVAVASLGATETATVGTGGVAIAANTTSGGNAGGTSSFGAHCSATGGGGGGGGVASPIAGGVGSGGDVNMTGCGGAQYSNGTAFYGIGGAAAGGGGGGGIHTNAGGFPGGGGGGGNSGSGSGAGANGLIILDYLR